MTNIKHLISIITSAKALFALVILVLAIPNIALCFTEEMALLPCLANVVLPCSAVWLTMTLSRKPGRMTWILFLLIFFAAFQLVLLYLFGRSIIAVDMFLNLITTNPGEVSELLGNIWPAVAMVVIIYVPVLALAVVSLKRHDSLDSGFLRRQRCMAAVGLAAGALCLGGSYASDDEYRAEIDLYPVNVFYNLALAVQRADATSFYKETSAHFKFGARSTYNTAERQVFVLVIGETARAMNFSLYGYGRDTNPVLSRTEGLTVFPKVFSQSNTTHKSVPMLMSDASAEDYNRIYKEKGLITAFREAGFHTTFISNQMPNHSFIDMFGEEADDWVFIKEKAEEPEKMKDGDILPFLNDVLKKGRHKELIVLHTYGSHFNYRERYPDSASHFKPDNATEATFYNRRELVNAYDNSIRYTDSFLGSVIAALRKADCVSALLYTSDHGENIFDDDRKLFLHASPIPSFYEVHVPFLVWTSPEYRRLYTTEAAALSANRHKFLTSSASVFHTMLGLARICTRYRNDSLSVASPRFTVRPYMYLNDHNRPVPMNKILKDKEDVKAIELRVKNLLN